MSGTATSGSAGIAGTIATLGPVGALPASGTVASALTIPAFWLLHGLGGAALTVAATLAVTALGWWATDRLLAARATPDADPSDVVIDEVAGMMLALWPLSIGLTMAGASAWLFPWPGWVLGFALFRALDILKPPPVSTAERAPGASGVMLDDLVAGALTALAATLAAGIAHGWF
ncbi:MAG: phosphatidylglycerophosphatase A [Pseudomonadota bacterium]